MEQSLQPIAMDRDEAYRKLNHIIRYDQDRFTGIRTFSVDLFVRPVNHHLYPGARLIILMQEDRTWTGLLTLSFQVSGRMSFPPPGQQVDWLINGQRGWSHVVASNGQTVSRNFRVGTDVMPGPLTVWMSTPVNVARTSGWVNLWLPEQLLHSMASADFGEFRFSGLEFVLHGGTHQNKGQPHPLRYYVEGLRAYVEGNFTGGAASLLAIGEKFEKKKVSNKRISRAFWIGLAIFFGTWVLLALYLAATSGSVQNQHRNAIAPSSTASPAVSPEPTKKNKVKR